MKRVFLMCISLIFASSIAFAGSVRNAKIGMVQTNSSGLKYIWFEGGTFEPGPCVYPNGSINWYSVIGEEAKTIVAIALTAATAGARVAIGGSGVCNGNYETVSYIQIKPNGSNVPFY